MRPIFYSIFFLFFIVGCQQQEQPSYKEVEEKVIIYVVRSDQSPVQDFTITLGEIGDTTGKPPPEKGMFLTPTDADGKTETTLRVGTIYKANLVIDDDTTQYEKFTVSEDVKDNVFTFIIESE